MLKSLLIGCLLTLPTFAHAQKATDAGWDMPRVKALLQTITSTSPGKCAACHTATASSVQRWVNAALDVAGKCFPNDDASDVGCLKAGSSANYNPSRFGFYAAGLHTSRFTEFFKRAYPGNPEQAAAAQADLVAQAGMPNDGVGRLTQKEFDELESWMRAGAPLLNAVLQPDPPQPCKANQTAALGDYLKKRHSDGWQARHRDASLPMFGCTLGQPADTCLQSFKDITTSLANKSIPQTIRRLAYLPRPSWYWIRSSPDGRYIGFGARPSSGILDLKTALTSKGATEYEVNAKYDPEFTPDNGGFAYAGSPQGITACSMSLLTRLEQEDNPHITLFEPECNTLGDGTYQSFGASLDGDQFSMVTGTYMSDFGGDDVPGVDFPKNATINVTLFTSDGLTYQDAGAASVGQPFHAESILSPSGGAIVTRFGANGVQSGYDVSLLDAHIVPGESSVKLMPVGQICEVGSKASFSYDERFLVFHRYLDSKGQPVTTTKAQKSDIVLIDLSTGKSTVLTSVPTGTFALFPHFRSDGWITFLIKTEKTEKEYVAATNALTLMGL